VVAGGGTLVHLAVAGRREMLRASAVQSIKQSRRVLQSAPRAIAAC